ncbi:hypothetical protein IVB27_25420 [Bradyrhizobium sp. 197]|uniref:hypothetical protein n=1 Tax=Bradyrhizobium sp. 197 TaxID=2782663 RepID=UPI001FF7A105|nr:hypothetical protein [Bradyrhizobium sp. 197]MCK1478051.1 hypothetical protein [Bradyrhizobium sp. 197]
MTFSTSCTPLDEADKTLPTEAAKLLSAVVKEVYGVGRISAQQLTLLMRHMKIDGDNQHCVYEKKLGRKYITRQGLLAVEDFVRKHPDEALEAFGSKASRRDYLLKVLKEMDKAIFVQPADIEPSPETSSKAAEA